MWEPAGSLSLFLPLVDIFHPFVYFPLIANRYSLTLLLL